MTYSLWNFSGRNRHLNPSLAQGGGDVQGFQRTSYNAVTPTENRLGELQMMEELAEHVGMKHTETTDSRYVAQPVDNFIFP